MIGFFIVLFILLISEKNLFAITFCLAVFLFASVFAFCKFNKLFKSRKGRSQLADKKAKEKEFLILMIFISFFSAIISLVRGFLPKILVGIYLLIILLGLFTNIIKRIVTRKRLPTLLKRLQQDPGIKVFEKVIDSYLSIDDLKNALKYANNALKRYPDSAILFTYKAVIYRRSHEDEKAVPLIKKALEIEPRSRFAREVEMKLQGLGFKVFPPPKSFWKL